MSQAQGSEPGPQLFVKKKPIEVEAMRLDADNAEQVMEWIRRFGRRVDLVATSFGSVDLRIYGSAGIISARKGDWITHDEDGMFRSWWPHHFAAYYEAVDVDAVTS